MVYHSYLCFAARARYWQALVESITVLDAESAGRVCKGLATPSHQRDHHCQAGCPSRNAPYLKHKQKRRSFLSGVFIKYGAGNETRTRDPDLGKVVLYQLSYSRNGVP